MAYQRLPKKDVENRRLLEPEDLPLVPDWRLAEERAFWADVVFDKSIAPSRRKLARLILGEVLSRAEQPKKPVGPFLPLMGVAEGRVVGLSHVEDYSHFVLSGLALSQFARRTGLVERPDDAEPSSLGPIVDLAEATALHAHVSIMPDLVPGFRPNDSPGKWYGDSVSVVQVEKTKELRSDLLAGFQEDLGFRERPDMAGFLTVHLYLTPVYLGS